MPGTCSKYVGKWGRVYHTARICYIMGLGGAWEPVSIGIGKEEYRKIASTLM
jgi:hypothetical protein